MGAKNGICDYCSHAWDDHAGAIPSVADMAGSRCGPCLACRRLGAIKV